MKQIVIPVTQKTLAGISTLNAQNMAPIQVTISKLLIKYILITHCYSNRVKKRCFEKGHFTPRPWIRWHSRIQEVSCIIGIVTDDIPICKKN